jgi:hypothetical protein
MKKLLAVLVTLVFAIDAAADPCGMVPPVWEGQGSPIKRVGPQRTYAFFKNGVETILIRPGFQGNVDNFGMLIPFPSVPSIRKVSDDTFPHILKAIAPPEITLDLRPRPPAPPPRAYPSAMRSSARKSAPKERPLRVDEVRVLKKEAVGMYEVAVLEAGSPKALNLWMTDHGYQYPKGMDATVRDYVKDRWCFVAVKARVGVKERVNPRPGMKRANPKMRKGGSFDGHVQAMAFRFKVKQPVIPMRLSAFNEGQLYNEIFFLGPEGVKIRGLPTSLVAQQLDGKKLHRNVTDLLPIKVIYSPDDRETLKRVNKQRLQGLRGQRDPRQHNGIARELFASDLAAAKTGRLALKFEDREKTLLNISERLNLRDKSLDPLYAAEVNKMRAAAVKDAIRDVRGMTLTWIRGDLPREFVAKKNLYPVRHRMKQPKKRRLTASKKQPKPHPGLGVSGLGSVKGGYGWSMPPVTWDPVVVDRDLAVKIAKRWPELSYWAWEEFWKP